MGIANTHLMTPEQYRKDKKLDPPKVEENKDKSKQKKDKE